MINCKQVDVPKLKIRPQNIISLKRFFEEGNKLFEVDMAFETVCLVQVRNHAGGRDITADCEIAYPELDSKMFLLLERKAGDIANEGAKGDGTQTILGGTNKLKGITGQCSYTIKYLDASRNISKNNCSYSL